jgi:chromate transporter
MQSTQPLEADETTTARDRSWLAVFLAFLRLGLTSFGGPVAHLGYFRAEFVTRRRWLDEAAYGDIIALCQFLPGPASSQVGITLGILRAGLKGGLAAWVGFSGPSALALTLFAYGVASLGQVAQQPWLHGLKIVAVAVVAQAVWGMARNLCPDRERLAIAAAATVLVLALPSTPGQVGAIVLGGLIGWRLLPGETIALNPLPLRLARGWSIAAIVLFFGLLVALPLAAASTGSHLLALFDAFYRSGALVFGGGHVVLPLLREAVVAPGWVSDDAFLAGYGAAQAVPGPLFTFAAYLGWVSGKPPNGLAGAVLALAALMLPGLLLVAGALPYWDAFRRRARAQAAMRGTNAAVVGILAAALYDPVWIGAVHDRWDFALAAAGFVLLTVGRAPPLAVVLATALAALALAALR